MNSPAPTVSVIVAVYNVSGQVQAAMESLLAQTFREFEALVIDDGSTDGSGEIAASVWGDDPRFRLVSQENRGLSGARNSGLNIARGEFVAFLDGDDAFAPEFIGRLHDAIERDGTDWAASAVSLCYPEGRQVPHPALHAVSEAGEARRIDLSDARDVARLFPSAWNKLYRRAAIGDLRFPEGSWFEDHEFFWALAAQCKSISYVPDPLYLHRRDREGQITGADSERVFEQFAVLDRLRPAIVNQTFSHAQDGFARLATRLVHERASVIKDQDRRARFIAQAREWFDDWGIGYVPDWDPTLSRGLGLMIQGVLPLSVVVIGEPDDPMATSATLDALASLAGFDFELFVIAPEQMALPEHLVTGRPIQRIDAETVTLSHVADQLNGVSVVFYSAGERPVDDGLFWLVNIIEQTKTDLVFGGLERAWLGYHDGWTDNSVLERSMPQTEDVCEPLELRPEQALRVYPVLGNRILRADLLRHVANHAMPSDGPTVQAFVLASALAAKTVGYTRLPVARTPALPGVPAPLPELARRVRDLPDAPFQALPPGWRGAVFLRLVRLSDVATGTIWSAVRTVFWAWRFGMLRASFDARPDPETPPFLRRIFRVWRSRQ